MDKKEFSIKLDAILNESKEFEGNFQIQTKLVKKLIDLSDASNKDVYFSDYLADSSVYYQGSDIFDLTLETLQETRFLDFSTIVENAKLLAQFGDHTELMELALIEYDHEVAPADYDDVCDMVDALQDAINE